MVFEGGAHPPPIVLYYANLLYPFHLRNLVIQLGVNYVVRPRWTDAIHEEWIGKLVASGRETRERLVRTRDIMKRVLPDADVRDYEHWIAGLTLPDPDDCHVLAAAIQSSAEVILTFNLKDFPSKALAPFGLVARDPDAFLCELYEADPEAILAVVEAARLNLSQTVPSQGTFIEVLNRQQLPKFAARLRRG